MFIGCCAGEGRTAVNKMKMSAAKFVLCERMDWLPEKEKRLNTEFAEKERRGHREDKRECGIRSKEPTLTNQGWGTLKFCWCLA
jgi:hypothetical protein